MNRKLPLLLFLLSVSTSSLWSQGEEEKNNYSWIFKVSPQHLTRNMLKVGGEFFNGKKTRSYSVLLQVVSNNKSNDPYSFDRILPYNGGGVEVSFRKYLSPFQDLTSKRGRAFQQGIYFSGFIQAGTYSGDFQYDDYVYNTQTSTYEIITYQYSKSAQNGALGFSIGVQRTFWKVLSLDAYLGAGYQIANLKNEGQTPEHIYGNYDYDLDQPSYYGILPKVGLLLGITL